MNMEIPPDREIYFNTIPHPIRAAFRDGSLTVRQYNLLLHIRSEADMYGHLHTTAQQLRSDVFSNHISLGTVNDLLLDLKKQGWITYASRKGNGGSFRIKNDMWLGEGGIWHTIHNHAPESINGAEIPTVQETVTELRPDVTTIKRRSDGLKPIDLIARIEKYRKTKNGPTYKDKDDDIDTNYDRTSKKKLVSEFVPKTECDARLLRIAESIGEEYMGFVFWVYSQRGDEGTWQMEKIAADLVDKPNVGDKRRYFNAEIRRQLHLGDASRS